MFLKYISVYQDRTFKSVQQSQSSSIVGITATKSDMMLSASWTQYPKNLSCLEFHWNPSYSKQFFCIKFFLWFAYLVLLYPILAEPRLFVWLCGRHCLAGVSLQLPMWGSEWDSLGGNSFYCPSLSASVSAPIWVWIEWICTMDVLIVQILCDADGRTGWCVDGGQGNERAGVVHS